ncbi:apolipoprotein L domain-containing protein 1-like [Sardina pilchardus]|uniref:apolipoprotein L domain-containing protein 1-like n=1 Tax=Sardina pilchardus TaxID=27697 RepID=UPI002E1593FD
MAGRGWAAPPPLPSYQNVWSGGDQPPSYEEALQETETQPLQAAAPPVASGLNPLYPPVPAYQPPVAYPPAPAYQPPGPYPRAPGYQPPGAYPPAPGYQTPGAHAPVPGYQPPGANSLPRPQRRESLEAQRVMSNEELMSWWRTVKPWEKMAQSPDTEPRMLAKKVHRVQRAVQLFRLLMSTHGVTLQNHIAEMDRTADQISKAYSTLKAAGATGGATRAVGSAAAITGIVLAPFTMGASLAITAVGVGVVAAGGLTKASIKNKVAINHDRRALDALVQDYRKKLEDMESCLRFIYTGMERVGRNNLSILKGVDMDSRQVSSLLQLSGEVAQGLGAAGKSSDLLRGFAGGIGTFYSKKDNRLLKKGKENKFGKTLRKVAGRLQTTQDELSRVADSLGRF